MKKIIQILFISVIVLMVTLHQSYGQKLFFCEGVTNDGYPINASDVFKINSDGGYLYVLVKLSYKIGCKSVSFDIYEIDYYGNKKYSGSIYENNLNSGWNWFYKQITFYQAGRYEVRVVDCYDYTVASGVVTIQWR